MKCIFEIAGTLNAVFFVQKRQGKGCQGKRGAKKEMSQERDVTEKRSVKRKQRREKTRCQEKRCQRKELFGGKEMCHRCVKGKRCQDEEVSTAVSPRTAGGVGAAPMLQRH